MAGLAGLSNCRSNTAPGVSRPSASARATASRIKVPGVRITSAPYALSSMTRSRLIASGIVSTRL